jgi:4'-phosphopantetheinyl transferase EntD
MSSILIPLADSIRSTLARHHARPIGFCVDTIERLRLGLYPEELELVARSSPKRRCQFEAGRNAARRAIEALGISPGPIMRGADAQPVWPSDVVGSIAHSERFALAMAAYADDFAGIGVDIERNESLPQDVSTHVLSAGEARRSAAENRETTEFAQYAFCAKEAIFKCINPITGEFPEFEDVSVKVDRAYSRFEICRGDTVGISDSVTGGFGYLFSSAEAIVSIYVLSTPA